MNIHEWTDDLEVTDTFRSELTVTLTSSMASDTWEEGEGKYENETRSDNSRVAVAYSKNLAKARALAWAWGLVWLRV